MSIGTIRAASSNRQCPRTPRSSVPNAFTLVELLVVIAIIGILVALLLPAIQAAREAARRAQCQSNIKNVSLAVLNYESSRKQLPEGMTFDPASAPAVQTMPVYGPNWIIKILPQLEDQALADAFDLSVGINQPGAGNKNVQARGTSISVLLCPSDSFNQTKYQGKSGSPHAPPNGNWARGNYAANAGRAFLYGSPTDVNSQHMGGPNTMAWSGKDMLKPSNLFCKRGVMGPNAGVKLKQITDGLSKTIMVGEIRAGITEQDARGVWALGHAGASLIAAYGANGDANGPNVCGGNSDDVYSDVADTPGQCTPATNGEAIAECMTAHGGGGFNQATVRSKHPGGAHVAMCDGSVQFINDDVETSGCYGPCCTVWDWMILSADNGHGGTYNGVNPRGAKCE